MRVGTNLHLVPMLCPPPMHVDDTRYFNLHQSTMVIFNPASLHPKLLKSLKPFTPPLTIIQDHQASIKRLQRTQEEELRREPRKTIITWVNTKKLVRIDPRSRPRRRKEKFLANLSNGKKRENMLIRNARTLMLGAAAYVRACFQHFVVGLILEPLEVLHEELAELLDFALEVGGAVP